MLRDMMHHTWQMYCTQETARYVDQGGGKRKGSFAMYLEPWHADVLDFLELRKNHGKDFKSGSQIHESLLLDSVFLYDCNQCKPHFSAL